MTGRRRRRPYEVPKGYSYRAKDPNAEWRLTDSARSKLSFAAVWPFIVISTGLALIVGSLIAHC
jgi:hypothetical protein